MEQGGLDDRAIAILGLSLAAAGMVAWYRRFRLPFSAFLTGMFLLGGDLCAHRFGLERRPTCGGRAAMMRCSTCGESPPSRPPRCSSASAAFLVGMWFDTRDRIVSGRHSATAFWCHLLAAPALVNTVAVTLLNGGGTGLLAIALADHHVLAW
jgi:hypothetical protein